MTVKLSSAHSGLWSVVVDHRSSPEPAPDGVYYHHLRLFLDRQSAEKYVNEMNHHNPHNWKFNIAAVVFWSGAKEALLEHLGCDAG